MRITAKARLREFYNKHPEATGVMQAWYQLALQNKALDFNELKETFRAADYVGGKFVVFNVGGNNYRVVAAIHFNTQRMYIRGVFTHAEYDKWSKEIRGK